MLGSSGENAQQTTEFSTWGRLECEQDEISTKECLLDPGMPPSNPFQSIEVLDLLKIT